VLRWLSGDVRFGMMGLKIKRGIVLPPIYFFTTICTKRHACCSIKGSREGAPVD